MDPEHLLKTFASSGIKVPVLIVDWREMPYALPTPPEAYAVHAGPDTLWQSVTHWDDDQPMPFLLSKLSPSERLLVQGLVQFRRAFEARFGMPVDVDRVLIHDAALTVASAIEQWLRLNPGRRPTRSQINREIRNLPPVSGFGGLIAFDAQGHNRFPAYHVYKLGQRKDVPGLPFEDALRLNGMPLAHEASYRAG